MTIDHIREVVTRNGIDGGDFFIVALGHEWMVEFLENVPFEALLAIVAELSPKAAHFEPGDGAFSIVMHIEDTNDPS